jgi:anti-sigma factor RsiW
MESTCEEIRDRLVAYADGELSEQDAQCVTEHLVACAGCRALAESLRRSLDLTKAIWLDNLEGSEAAPAAAPGRRRTVRWVWRFAVAASILIAIAGVLIVSSTRRATDWAPMYAEMERSIARAAAAARLLAATQILATCEGTESIVRQQYRYILRHYGDTPVAARLRTGNHMNLGELEND